MRANGEHNPDYPGTFVFTNDFAALQPDSPTDRRVDGLLVTEGERGTSRVVCYSPRHDLGMASMAVPDIRTVVDMWVGPDDRAGRSDTAGSRCSRTGAPRWAPRARTRMARSGPARRCPTDAAREDATQRAYAAEHGQRMLLAYAEQELGGPRVVEQDQDWLVVVPYWAAWPYETLILPLAPGRRGWRTWSPDGATRWPRS